jgi:formylmethanofuran dehydrogenase subunit B
VFVGSDDVLNFSQPARDHLRSIPYVALDPKETPTTRHAAVAFAEAGSWEPVADLMRDVVTAQGAA